MFITLNGRIGLVMKSNKVTGFCFYNGPSEIDGKPIMGVAIFDSTNRKTGNMVQTYIMRSDISPTIAASNGEDESICGNCAYRKRNIKIWHPKKGWLSANKRRCYVNLGQGPLAVYKSFCKGNYPDISSNPSLLQKISGAMLRLGTYGDPMAIPYQSWLPLLQADIQGHTGYSHQWDNDKLASPWIGKLMASVENASQRLRAIAKGWRVFQVLNTWDDSASNSLGVCPSSKEYIAKTGKKIPCSSCKLCNGSKANIGIRGHGPFWSDDSEPSTARISLL